MQDCASSNKIKENKYKILRMSLLLGADSNDQETLHNFEDASRDIDAMNDEVYFQGKKLPPQKTILPIVEESKDGITTLAYDGYGNSYRLKLTEIFEDDE